MYCGVTLFAALGANLTAKQADGLKWVIECLRAYLGINAALMHWKPSPPTVRYFTDEQLMDPVDMYTLDGESLMLPIGSYTANIKPETATLTNST